MFNVELGPGASKQQDCGKQTMGESFSSYHIHSCPPDLSPHREGHRGLQQDKAVLSDRHLDWDDGNQCSVHRGQPKAQAGTQPSMASLLCGHV